ncbi:MAG: hypothetical protein V1655_03755 [bacterium]
MKNEKRLYYFIIPPNCLNAHFKKEGMAIMHNFILEAEHRNKIKVTQIGRGRPNILFISGVHSDKKQVRLELRLLSKNSI